MWFDLYHLMSSSDVTISHSDRTEYEKHLGSPIQMASILQPGTTRLVLVNNHTRTANVDPLVLDARLPTALERAYLIELGFGDEIQSWFPDLVISAAILPPFDHLPKESRLPVRIVHILKAAIRSPQSGLDELYSSSSEDWGGLRDLADQIEYECLLSLGRVPEANNVSSRLEPQNVELIAAGKGLIATYLGLVQAAEDE